MKAGLHAILQKINEDAEAHGKARCEQIQYAVDQEIGGANSAYREDLDKQREILKKHNEHEYARRLEHHRSRLNRELLAYQHKLVDEIFYMAANKLRKAPKEEFCRMFQAAVKGLTGSFILQIGELSVDKFDSRAIDEAKRANAGLEIVLSSETIPHRSGFILKDDGVEYDCLFRELMEDKKSEQAAAIIREVFGSSGDWTFN